MKKNISRNPLWPDWYNGKKIDEVQFGRAFLEQWPLKCVNGTLYTLDGPVEDESEIKQRILENIEEYVTSGLSKKVTNILETIKLLAFSDPFPIEQDCIHLQNGVYHLPDGSFQESRLFCQNRLPVKYDPKAASPDRWLTFLHELLDDADIPTLQEYLGYCLIPSTKGQKMMLIVGKGGEGKSRIGLVLKRLMGDAASNGSVQKVENNRFARADLERRLLMIDDDMDMNALPKTNYIKTIVTAEAKLDLERKGVQSYQRDIYARFLCFGNGALTSLYDHSDGFFRRQLILTTKDKPTDRTDDPFLVEKMCAELEGILLWCLEGLHRLVQNDFRFTVSERAAANVDTFFRGKVEMLGIRVQEGDPMVGIPLSDLFRRASSLSILFSAAERKGEVIIPNGDFVPRVGDKLYVTGSPKDLSSYLRTLGRDLPGIHSAFLIGGSRIAHYLSKMLLSMGVRVTLVESNEAHCRRLSESLPEALILHGDGTDQELLLSEHFTNNDAFIALTGRDEDNLISALYAQQQGLRKVVAKCNRVNYSSVVQAAGLDCVVAPKLITVARILRLVRGFEDKSGSVMTALYRISDTDVEAAEFILHENTPHLGIPLKDLEIRKGFLIVALLHENQVVVPSGGTVLSPGDRVIVISHGQGIQTFRDIFLKP